MEKYRRITRRDRYQIQKYLALEKSIIWIANRLGFHRSTIYREKLRGTVVLERRTNTTRKGEYSALKAQRDAISISSNARLGCFYRGSKIKGWVEDQIRMKLSEGLSPEQISYRLKMEKNVSISTEGIYKFILSCKKRNEDLHQFLRRHRRRQRRFKRRNRYWEMQYKRRKSIDDRPFAANERTQFGHWERDLMLGKRGTGALLTIVDRKSQYTLLERVSSTFAREVNSATAAAMMRTKLPCKSITNDNGHEFGEFWNLEESLKTKIYFTHPLCPWERGTVENTIGLLRQFIPKGSDLKDLNDESIKELEQTINSRPRKKLGFKTPMEILTGKRQKIFTQKRFAPFSTEYYEQFYLTTEEIEELRKLRAKSVAMYG